MKLKSIPKNTVVHTSTEEKAKELLAILHENGWIMGGYTDYIIENAEGIQINSETDWSWWENIEDARKGNCTILTLADFKRLYCEEEKPQPKFEVGDIAIFPEIDKPLPIHDIMNGVAMSLWDDGKIRATACLEDLILYTEPETKPTEDMETKENRNLSQGVANCDKPESKQLNLCELLQGHKGEKFYSPMFGERELVEIGDKDYPISFGEDEYYDFGIDGCWSDGGQPVLFPSRELYEQYPLDAYTAWMKWKEEQNKPFICIHWGEMDADGNEEEDYTGNIYFSTPADRDKCIEEIKSIIEKYSKK